mmetsp:Transcript_12651/g.20450  ORF Transcript_12651/g.20450 Transcript_12651/m.20450 type:complete len:182 (-) Transcript_12651:152-697(-)
MFVSLGRRGVAGGGGLLSTSGARGVVRGAFAGKMDFANDDTTPEERAKAELLRSGGGGCSVEDSLDGVAPFEIDQDAKQKYVLIRVGNGNEERFLVRGKKFAAYHVNAAQATLDILRERGVEYTVLGGGRIRHSNEQKTIDVFGYSYGFPWDGGVKRHDITVSVLQNGFPEYKVRVTDEEY